MLDCLYSSFLLKKRVLPDEIVEFLAIQRTFVKEMGFVKHSTLSFSFKKQFITTRAGYLMER